MVFYKCERCGFKTSYKNNFRKHIYRKFPCFTKINKMDISDIQKCFEMKKSTSLTVVSSQNELKINVDNRLIKNTHICNNCNTTFTMYKNLWRHQQKYCNKAYEINEIENLRNEILELKREIKTNIISNNTINSNSNNIIINNFGSENMAYITKKMMKRMLKQGSRSIPNLIKQIHFNPEHPENHNVRINNKKLKFAEIRENNKWKYKHKKAVLDDLVDFGYVTLEGCKENSEDNLDNLLLKGFKRLMKKYEMDKNEIVANVELEVLNGMNNIDI